MAAPDARSNLIGYIAPDDMARSVIEKYLSTKNKSPEPIYGQDLLLGKYIEVYWQCSFCYGAKQNELAETSID